MKKSTCLRLILLLLLLSAGCATHPAWVRYEVYFGLTADSGRVRITAEQWEQFQTEEILTRFPDGFTVHHADGHWRSDGKSYAEPSMILDVVAPCGHEADEKIDAIARAYVRQFHQDAVLKVKAPVAVEFVASPE